METEYALPYNVEVKNSWSCAYVSPHSSYVRGVDLKIQGQVYLLQSFVFE